MSDHVWIGIECDVNTSEKNGRRYARIHEAYVDAIVAAGGIPLLLAPVRDATVRAAMLERVDALVLTGGDDMPPEVYGETLLECPRNSSVDARRFEAGRNLVVEARERRVPTLGICYGAQLMNVALGGTLVQDIELQLGGSPTAHRTGVVGHDAQHDVEVEKGSRLARALGRTRAHVNSAHHQAVKKVAPGLKVVARCPDGVIEGLEGDDDAFLLAVQWHPERLSPTDPAFSPLVALVDAARERKRSQVLK